MKLITCRSLEGGVRRELLGLSLTFFSDDSSKKSLNESTPLIEHHVDIERLDLPPLAAGCSLKKLLGCATGLAAAGVGLWVGYWYFRGDRNRPEDVDMEVTGLNASELNLLMPKGVCKAGAQVEAARFQKLISSARGDLSPESGGMEVTGLNASELNLLRVPKGVCKAGAQVVAARFQELISSARGGLCPESGGMWISDEEDGSHTCHYFGYPWGVSAGKVLSSLPDVTYEALCNTREEADGVLAQRLYDVHPKVLSELMNALVRKAGDRTVMNPDCLWTGKPGCRASRPTECGDLPLKWIGVIDSTTESFVSIPDETDRRDYIVSSVTKPSGTGLKLCMTKNFMIPFRNSLEDRFGREDEREVTLAPVKC